MGIIKILAGILFVVISCVRIMKLFEKNEWRMSLLELNLVIKEQDNSNIKTGAIKIFQNQVMFSLLITLLFFFIGTYLVFTQWLWFGIIAAIIFIWIIIGIYQTISTLYSKKNKLLNYLYSPYLFAWKKDHLSEYSDTQIAKAICKICGISSSEIIDENVEIKDFLKSLCEKTRPQHEYEQYDKVIENSIEEANKLKWIG